MTTVSDLKVDDKFICPPSVYAYSGIELQVSKIQYAAGFKRILTVHIPISDDIQSRGFKIRISESTPIERSAR